MNSRYPFRRIACLTLMLLFSLAAVELARNGDDSESNKTTVSIKGMKFSPKSLTIKAGQTVLWKNADTHDHTVIADDGSFKSDNLTAGDTFTHTFKKPGSYPYSCSYHPRMKAEIVVEK